jgi:hypothetical protein
MWIWLLITWAALSPLLALVIGRALAIAGAQCVPESVDPLAGIRSEPLPVM